MHAMPHFIDNKFLVFSIKPGQKMETRSNSKNPQKNIEIWAVYNGQRVYRLKNSV
jgi:hypothetical protein